MKVAGWRIILITLFLCIGCTVQDAHMIYRPEPTAKATIVPTVTPTPEIIEIPAVSGQPFRTDANGVLILSEEDHYLTYYVTFNDIRVYEFGESVFLDGVAVNSFPQTLTGGLRIVFQNENGVNYGYGDFYTADGRLTLLPGENKVYADILTEVDVQQMNWVIAVIGAFGPRTDG